MRSSSILANLAKYVIWLVVVLVVVSVVIGEVKKPDSSSFSFCSSNNKLAVLAKVMKTQNNKSILIELEDEGWKFNCENFDISIDNGIYLGIKNSYKENQNICVSGMSKEENLIIKWEIAKI